MEGCNVICATDWFCRAAMRKLAQMVIFWGYEPCQLVTNDRYFRDHLCLSHPIQMIENPTEGTKVLMHTIWRSDVVSETPAILINRVACNIRGRNIFKPHQYIPDPGGCLASNRNEYQKQKNHVYGEGVKQDPARKADGLNGYLWADCKTIWDPQHLTTLRTSKACYGDSLTFYT
jgi:hypothetical protein